MHLGAHVAGVDGVDAQVGALDAEDRRPLLERGLGGAVAAPAVVGLNAGVGGDVENRAAVGDVGEGELRECQWGQHVDAVDVLEDVERVLGELWLRARPQNARVVDEQVDLRPGDRDERAPVRGIRDVAR